jgi:hypothetical protein
MAIAQRLMQAGATSAGPDHHPQPGILPVSRTVTA